jgi:hypothetical protein
MYRALAAKELRENAAIGFLAIAALALAVLSYTGCDVFSLKWSGVDAVPFLEGNFLNWFAGLSFAFAIVLGFRQAAWESVRGTSVFLLHRPMDHRKMYATKIAVGLAMVLTLTGVALAIYAFWAATPGTHASPFSWSWTTSWWIVWFAATMWYCAAFLTGIRPARWFGSRLFPLLAVLFPVALTMSPFPAIMRIAVVVGVDAILLVAIASVVRLRDYP